MTEPIVVEASTAGRPNRRLQILLAVLLVAVVVYAVPKVLFRDSGSAGVQVVPPQTPAPALVEEPEPVVPPAADLPADDTESIADAPVRARDGKNPFEPRMPAVARPANAGTAGIVPPAPVLPPAVVPPPTASPLGTAPPLTTPVFGAPPVTAPLPGR